MSTNGIWWSMRDSPLVQELLAQRSQDFILLALETRFGTVPPEVSDDLRTVMDEAKLSELNRLSVTCPDSRAFHARLGLLQKEVTEPEA